MNDTRKVPLYQSRRRSVSGVSARLADGSSADAPTATWLIALASLGGLTPAVGDRCRGADGVWWTVKTVATPVAGEWPLTCDREPEGGA